MFILGDVLVIVSIIVGLASTGWALIVACGLMFPNRCAAATEILASGPGKSIARGLLVTLLLGGLSIITMAGPNPIAKILGVAILLVLLAIAVVGASGMSKIAADRIEQMAPGLTPFSSYCRAAGFIVWASMLPFLGWFLFAPVAILASIGAGWPAVVRRSRREAVAPEVIL